MNEDPIPFCTPPHHWVTLKHACSTEVPSETEPQAATRLLRHILSSLPSHLSSSTSGASWGHLLSELPLLTSLSQPVGPKETVLP